MKFNKLPGTSVAVSDLCLGSMYWGERNTENEAHAQLDRATDRGINFIDTGGDVLSLADKAAKPGSI